MVLANCFGPLDLNQQIRLTKHVLLGNEVIAMVNKDIQLVKNVIRYFDSKQGLDIV